MLYHPPHLAKGVFTHIEQVADGYFVVACSTTERMIPCGRAQRVLKLKLSLDDIEREVQGPDLHAPERLLWRRWLEAENARHYRKSRVQAPCCGRYKHRYQIEQDAEGNWWCDACWSAVPKYAPAPVADAAPGDTTLVASKQCNEEVVDVVVVQESVPGAPAEGDVAAGTVPAKPVLLPRDDWRWDADKPLAKKRRNTPTGTVDFWNQHKGYGYAHFDGYHERVLFHSKDCIDVDPSAGAAVSAFAHRRRRDGKLQAFKVMSGRETIQQRMDRVHSQLLGSG